MAINADRAQSMRDSPVKNREAQEQGRPNRKFNLQGSVRMSRGVIRVNGRVLEYPSGKVVWSHSYECNFPVSDNLSAETAIAAKIVSEVTRTGTALLGFGLDLPNVPAASVGSQPAAC